jgi:hypothetical protein
MHEEISANVAAILTADFEYQLAKDKQKVIKKYENTYMKFYFDAIKDGTINPECTDSLERDKKYGLLMNGAIRMWEQKFRAHYTPSLISSLTQYLKNYGFNKPHDKNYHRALTHLYSFGGIDLSKYIKDDAEFVDIKLKMCDELAGVKSLNKSKNERQSVVDDIFFNGDKLRKFPDAKRPVVMQHLFVATKLKFELEKLNAYDLRENSSAVTAAYNKVMYELAIDANFKKMILSSADFKMTRVPFDDKEYKTYLKFYPVSNLLDKEDFEIIRHFYQFRNVDLTRLINGFDINDKPLDEPYIRSAYDYTTCTQAMTCGPLIIPEKHYMMLGDNRGNSQDGRYWGLLSEDRFIGKAVFLFWPFNRVKSLKLKVPPYGNLNN